MGGQIIRTGGFIKAHLASEIFSCPSWFGGRFDSPFG
jgi:hypothetical protein